MSKLKNTAITIRSVKAYLRNLPVIDLNLSKKINRYIALARVRRYLFIKSPQKKLTSPHFSEEIPIHIYKKLNL